MDTTIIEQKKRITIFRVEDEFGLGPYHYVDDITYDIVAHHDRDRHHPTPSCDKGIQRCICDYEICGFLNMEQLKKWFTDLELNDLKDNGYIIKEIEVAKITAIGEYQVLAIKKKGKRWLE